MAQLQTEWDVVLVAIMTDASKFIFKAKGGAPKKWCGRHRPALYSAAKSVGGGGGSEEARGRGQCQLETVGLPL